jgi:UDP-2,4-diacetamido-2,4,6-trideoxy-beta-L-altropyranose hydrolase
LLELRKIVESDAQLIFEWANDDEVRSNAINTHKINWEDHINWFDKKLQSADTYVFIAFLHDEPVGQIRFDKENEDYTVDYSIAKNHRGKGLGTEIVKAGIKTLSEIINKPFRVVAQVKEENIASAKVFTKLHFTKTGIVSKNNSTLNCYKLTIT